jgi:hypothetical protein
VGFGVCCKVQGMLRCGEDDVMEGERRSDEMRMLMLRRMSRRDRSLISILDMID